MMYSPISLLALLTLLLLLALLIHRMHLLMMLLLLETAALSLIAFLTLTQLNSPQSNTFLIFMFLSVAACEATLGLTTLVIMARSHGTDRLKSLSMNSC